METREEPDEVNVDLNADGGVVGFDIDQALRRLYLSLPGDRGVAPALDQCEAIRCALSAMVGSRPWCRAVRVKSENGSDAAHWRTTKSTSPMVHARVRAFQTEGTLGGRNGADANYAELEFVRPIPSTRLPLARTMVHHELAFYNHHRCRGYGVQ